MAESKLLIKELLPKIEVDLTQIILDRNGITQTKGQPDKRDIEAHFAYNDGCSFFKKYTILTGDQAKTITNDGTIRKCTVYVTVDTLIHPAANEKYFSGVSEVYEALYNLSKAHAKIIKYLKKVSIRSGTDGSASGWRYDITPGSFASKSI